MMSQPKLPLKSVAGALLFSVLLGPVGLLYSSTLGGALLIFLTVLQVSNAFYRSAIILWLISCIWSVVAVNRYNKKVLRS
jgi:hypothetical protein